jgi:hypothetical protein
LLSYRRHPAGKVIVPPASCRHSYRNTGIVPTLFYIKGRKTHTKQRPRDYHKYRQFCR